MSGDEGKDYPSRGVTPLVIDRRLLEHHGLMMDRVPAFYVTSPPVPYERSEYMYCILCMYRLCGHDITYTRTRNTLPLIRFNNLFTIYYIIFIDHIAPLAIANNQQ